MRVAHLALTALSAVVFTSSVGLAEMAEKDVPLLEAIADHDVAAAQKAIAAGANPSYMSDDLSPLSFAIAMSDAKMVDALLAAGSDPTMKDSKGTTAIDLAESMHATAIRASLKSAAAKRSGTPAVDPTPAAAAAAIPAVAPATPSVAAPVVTAGKTGTFDDVEFKTPNPKIWKSAVVDDNLVFASPLPPPDFCTITVFASRDCKGDDDAFKKAFDDVIQASLKKHDTVKVDSDSGPQAPAQKLEGTAMLQRVIKCEAKDFHTVHFFVGIHSHDRLQVIGYQSSGEETFTGNQKDAEAFLSSISVVTKTTLNP